MHTWLDSGQIITVSPSSSLTALIQEIGLEPVRLDVYQTTLGSTPQACSVERQLLLDGHIQAIAFSSTAEVSLQVVEGHTLPAV